MSSPKSRAQSSSVPVLPDYVTGAGIDSHAIEVRSKLHPFAQKNLDENVLHLFENTLVLGPHWFGPVPPEMAELMKKDAEAPLCFESSSALASHSWVSKNLSRSFPSSEVRNSPIKWADWIDRLLPRFGAHWKRAGIHDAILLSRQSINRDENLLAAALCFWNSASNTFDFRIGPMAPTLLDMAQIFGFRPHGRPVDAIGDYHRKKDQQKLAKPFTISPALINQNCSFSNYLRKFSAEKDKDQQHMLFLLYWLNRFILPNRSSAVLLEYRHLAEALHNHTDVGLGPTVLAHLFKNLHTATLEYPLNLSAPGAFWMIQIWLQVYFPELRYPDIVLPENQVLAQPLLSAEVPKRSIGEYLMMFRHCTKRSAAQWQMVIRRTYPWFQPGHRLFEKEPEEESARTDFRKKFLSVTLPRDLPHGGGKPPNYHLGAEVYHPNFCARQLGCPQLIPLKSYRSCNRGSSWRDADDLEVHKDARCAVNKINNSADALYPSWELNSCSSVEFDAWWKARFRDLPASSTALQVLFKGWDNWNVHSDDETHRFMVQTIKDINMQIIEDPSLTKNIGSQPARSGEVFVNSVIAAGDLELPSGDGEEEEEEEEEGDQAEQTPVEATSPVRRKRKETAQSAAPVGGPSPPLTKSKRLRKKIAEEYVAPEGTGAVPTTTSGTDDDLREAFEAVEQERELEELEKVGEEPQEKAKSVEEEEEIPAEVIAESIALARKQQEDIGAGLTNSEVALFDDPEAEHSTAAPAAEDQVEQSGSEPGDQAEQVVPTPEIVAGVAAAVPGFVVEAQRTARTLAVRTTPLQPPIVAMPIHSLAGSSATASFADPELAEFEAMDLDAQLDRLEKLSSPVGKTKSRAVEEAMERLKIWQSAELELDEDREAFDQLMKDLDLLHRQNMAPRPILEMSLVLARDVLNLHDRYEDLKPTFETSEFCKATHEANLADFAKQKAELDQMVAGYKEAKAAGDKLEKEIAELQKQLAERREVQHRLGAGLSSKTKATFLVQNMVAASRPALEIAEASIHQGVLLQKELSTKKTNLQETLRKLGF
ncbi:unnamed protein product [Prunus armeniaca]